MRLQTKIIITITVILLFQILGVLYFNVRQTEHIVQNQLRENANNAAYMLAIALQDKLKSDERDSIDLMARALFDSGEYQKINVVLGNEVMSDYETKTLQIESVPSWFLSLLRFDVPEVKADLMLDWRRAGVITIKVSPGYTYISLWKNIKSILLSVLIINAISILFIIGMLAIILHPVMLSINQIQNLMLGEYKGQEKIPGTREFKQLVLATNQIGKRLKYLYKRMSDISKKLQNSLYFIPNTPISNDNYLQMRLNFLLSMKKEYIFGTFTYLPLAHLDSDEARAFYQKFYQHGFSKFGSFIAKYKKGILIVLPFENNQDTRQLIEASMAEHTGLFKSKKVCGLEIRGYWGDENAQSILTAVDDLIAQRKQSYLNGQMILKEGDIFIESVLEDAVGHEQIELSLDSIYSVLDDNKPLLKSCYFLLNYEERSLISNNAFLRIAEKQGYATELDKYMLKTIFSFLTIDTSVPLLTYSVSEQSLKSQEFIDWIGEKLSEYKDISSRFCLELNEQEALYNLENTIKLTESLKLNGAKFALNNFGRAGVSLLHLKKLPVDYLKLNGSFTVGIKKSKENQNFVKELCYIANSLDISTIAVEVANDEEVKLLGELGVRAYSRS